MLNVQISKKVLSNINGTRDITFWATGTIDPWLAHRLENKIVIHKTVQKYKDRFKEAWKELSDK